MDSAHDPTVQSTVLLWARQLGKTEVENNVAGYFMDADPSPIMMVQPSLELATSWSEVRLAPMLRDCPCFRGKVKDPRTRDSGNRILNKLFLGGDISVVGANASTGLRSRPRRVVLMDEVDGYPASIGSEGDPCLIAEKSTESFCNSVIFKSSTPTIKNLSRIEKEFFGGKDKDGKEIAGTDQRYWFCPCPSCGAFQTLKWHQVLWGPSRVESWNIHNSDKLQSLEGLPDDGSDAIYECEACHAHLNDAARVKMIRAGEWRPTAPFKGKRGYALNGIYSPFKAKKGFKTRLHQMAAQFLEAKAGGIQTLKAWTNTFLAETWEEEVNRVEPHSIMKRAEDYTPTTLPEDIILGLAAVDVQKTWLQLEVIGLGLDDETWGIESLTIQGDPEQNEVWQDLSDQLTKTYLRTDGVVIPITATAIDMRFKPIRVRTFVRTAGIPRVYPVYGVAHGRQNRLVTISFNKRSRMKTFALDRKMANDTIFARLQVPEPGPRYMHFPNEFYTEPAKSGDTRSEAERRQRTGYNEEFYQQLTAEVLKTDFKHGFPHQHYEKIRERNEALDIRGMLLGIVEPEMLNPNLTAIARRLKVPPKDYVLNPTPGTQPEPPKTPEPPKRAKIRVGKW